MRVVPLLVVSCDKYDDLWRPFFQALWKRWPDCPFPVYLGTNFLSFDDSRVTSIQVGPDRSWTENLGRMLDAVGAEYVLLFLEDFLIRKPVDTAELSKAIDYWVPRRIDCARLCPLPPPTPLPPSRLEEFPKFGTVPVNAPYRVSTQPALWRVATLRHYLVPGCSPWEFEYMGTQMSRYANHRFVGPFEPLIDYYQSVEKGRWTPQGLSLCSEMGVHVDLARRPAYTTEELNIHYLSGARTSRLANLKAQAIDAFTEGRRRDGFAHALRYLREKPFALDMYGITAFGLSGRQPLAWLQRQHVLLKVWRAGRRIGGSRGGIA